ncbi:MAG: hypothetical protein BGP24_03925 [Lysobacterales bacterium 69-70]|nr:MAG: hypothetical protein ABT27_12335 [Xanthomonadaceae bacterium SCN 69-25]OJZ01881.1 MAG: hypothetical protein BGP24_03925 [Xanthomonadales bacterium 69-70]
MSPQAWTAAKRPKSQCARTLRKMLTGRRNRIGGQAAQRKALDRRMRDAAADPAQAIARDEGQ